MEGENWISIHRDRKRRRRMTQRRKEENHKANSDEKEKKKAIKCGKVKNMKRKRSC